MKNPKRKLIKGENDLATVCPELAKQWHPEKNGDMMPCDVTSSSKKRVWWLCDKGHEWQANISTRFYDETGCPYCSGRNAIKGVTDLLTLRPDIAAEWDYDKNDTSPEDWRPGSHVVAWWKCKKGHEWKTTINDRTQGAGCPFCSNNLVLVGYNDLATTNPEIAKEWHPTKNGSLTPYDVVSGSGKKVWWYLPYDDPDTGKHFDFEWEEVIRDRVNRKSGCPYLSGRRIWKGFNDLATVNPELAKEWHPYKNGKSTPLNVTTMSNKKVWWKCNLGHEWEATIYRRNSGTGCPYCSNNLALAGYNDLATTHPELAKEWHPTKNGKLTPRDVVSGSAKKVWWYLPYDDPDTGKHFDFEWKAAINKRVAGKQCPYLVGRSAYIGFNDLVTKNPELAQEWHPTKNGTLTPYDVTSGSGKKVWWLCPECGYEWHQIIFLRVNNAGCPNCGHKA